MLERGEGTQYIIEIQSPRLDAAGEHILHKTDLCNVHDAIKEALAECREEGAYVARVFTPMHLATAKISSDMSKEDVYDSEISPLVQQILNVCKDHEISNLMAFHIPSHADNDLCCTSGMLSPEWGSPSTFRAAHAALQGKPSMMAFAVTVGGEDA